MAWLFSWRGFKKRKFWAIILDNEVIENDQKTEADLL